jgi:hypothetical protein
VRAKLHELIILQIIKNGPEVFLQALFLTDQISESRIRSLEAKLGTPFGQLVLKSVNDA